MNGWQPIETAPKGRLILTYGVMGYRVGYCGRRNNAWANVSGGVWRVAPTHWQPLPEPPA